MRFDLACRGRKEIPDIQFVEDLPVDTVDTANALNDPGRIIRNIVVHDDSRSVQVKTFRNRIRRDDDVEIISLSCQFNTRIEVGLDDIFIRLIRVSRAVFEYSCEACALESTKNIVGSIRKFAKNNNLSFIIQRDRLSNLVQEKVILGILIMI